MSASTSPGRTWTLLAGERRLPVLAGETSAAVPNDVRGGTGLSSMGGEHSSAFLANLGDQVDSLQQPDNQYYGPRRVGIFVVPLPLEYNFS